MTDKNKFNRLLKAALITVFSVLVLDQAIKIWIKTHLHLGEEIHIAGNWFIIHFTENNGMAFGLELAGGFGKLFLSVFRIIAAGAIGYYCYTLIRSQASLKLVLFISLIFAGAVGNIIDSIFYGLIFTESDYRVAEMFPDKGYAPLLHGKVVDMFYFPIIEGTFPDWVPFWGNENFIFFRPVFNLADSAITLGVFCIILFQSHFLHEPKKPALPHHENEMADQEIKTDNTGSQTI